ncbi:MAG: DUF5615 family PIN-like protein [bacterium]|nr:DUF5615 family PIN-like protein [bacterium]
MRFLVDNALSPKLAQKLHEHGFETLHVRQLGMQHASDQDIFEYASKENYTIVSADTDFSHILARMKTTRPTFILFRCSNKSTENLFTLLMSHLPYLEADIQAGSIIVFDDNRVRVRALPIIL